MSVEFYEAGKKRKGVKAVCSLESCQKEFIYRPAVSKGLFCSQYCSSVARRERKLVQCAHCKQYFERVNSKLSNSKSGLYFCNRDCKEAAQAIDGTCPEIRPSHYGSGTGLRSYRRTAKEQLDIGCSVCTETELFLLVVHHIDGNRENNNPENLEVVCHNCHCVRHLYWNGNSWKYCTSYLTPRDIVAEFDAKRTKSLETFSV